MTKPHRVASIVTLVARVDRRIARSAMGLLTVALLSGCGGDDPPNPGPTQTSAVVATATVTSSPASPTVAPQLEVGPIIWTSAIEEGTGGLPEGEDWLSTTVRTIYAVLPVGNAVPGTVFSADWSYNDTSLDAMSTIVTIESDHRSVEWIEFHLTRSDERWPDGDYAITVRANGVTVQQGEIELADR